MVSNKYVILNNKFIITAFINATCPVLASECLSTILVRAVQSILLIHKFTLKLIMLTGRGPVG